MPKQIICDRCGKRVNITDDTPKFIPDAVVNLGNNVEIGGNKLGDIFYGTIFPNIARHFGENQFSIKMYDDGSVVITTYKDNMEDEVYENDSLVQFLQEFTGNP